MIIKLQASAKFRSSVFTKNPTTVVGNEEICSVQEQNQIKEVSGAFNYFDKANSKCNKFDGSINHRETFQVGHGKRLETKPRLESELKSSEGEKLSASAPGKGKQVLSSREAQVVRSVILVASIFVTCQTPFMAYSLARRIETQFDDVVKNVSAMENSNFVQNRTLDSLNIAAVPDDIRAMLAKLPFQTAYYTITQHFDTASNMTRFVYREIDDGGLADKINDIFNRNILTWTSFITVLICLTIMIIKLQASAKFRSSVFTKNPTTVVGNEGICSVQEQNQIKEVSGAFNYFDKANSKCNKFDGSINHRETFQVGHGKRLETKPRLESELKSSEGEKLSASAPGKGKQVLSSREAQVISCMIKKDILKIARVTIKIAEYSQFKAAEIKENHESSSPKLLLNQFDLQVLRTTRRPPERCPMCS
ncbi:hypothetical protein RRG08_039528 [Elysia crispata]|uniref:Uncharacterized protein n=1 Tax=Elysia crispata TaxID=231223 RepID=A0AAE1D0M0_9GAST|nr:hypothetical protein RRG08_039528 [Elysia crispata]